MSRPADPERIYQARRAATFAKLIATGAIEGITAEHLISAWERSPEATALDRLTPSFWDAGERWIATIRRHL